MKKWPKQCTLLVRGGVLVFHFCCTLIFLCVHHWPIPLVCGCTPAERTAIECCWFSPRCVVGSISRSGHLERAAATPGFNESCARQGPCLWSGGSRSLAQPAAPATAAPAAPSARERVRAWLSHGRHGREPRNPVYALLRHSCARNRAVARGATCSFSRQNVFHGYGVC